MGRIMGLARPSVRPSGPLSVLSVCEMYNNGNIT